MALNINKDVEDTFYRYKMPKLQAKVEGKGNGIKTVIVNCTEIARALYRKPMYVTKYFGCELGAQVNVDEKNDRYIVNGSHDAEKLQQLLHGFIKKFVLCPNCNNPETDLSVKKRAETVKATCKACGASKELDPLHRLTQYIIKNPPEVCPNSTAKTTSKPKGSDEDEESPAAAENSTVPACDQDDDDDWGEDATEEAQKQRLEELSSAVKNLTVCADAEKSKSVRAQLFFTCVSGFYNSPEGLMAHMKDVLAEADRLDISSRAVLVLVEVLLKDPETIITQLKKHAKLFKALIEDNETPAKAQMNMLNGLITLVDQCPAMLKKVCLYVKTLYDEEICEEEIILEWGAKSPSSKHGSKKVHAEILSKCQVFFDWLKEAETEDDDDEEEEDEKRKSTNGAPAPVNTKTPSLPVNKVAANLTSTVANGADESDDDLDIDAI